MQETMLLAVLYRPVASPAKEAARNALETSQIVGADKLAETLEQIQ